LEAALFFTNISGNKQLGAAGIRSLCLSLCSESIDTSFAQFWIT
ncbi:hypothetical protein T10_12598, partial [Trichinella papuae]